MRTLATQTLKKIDEYLERDQGNAYRVLLKETLPLLDDAYREDDTPHRAHLGASLVGGKCPRKLWYTFRWASAPNFSGRILRLFNRGHLEEGRIVALLRMIGCTVYQFDENGKQFRIVGVDGHYGGGLDAVVGGIEEVGGVPILAEFKTHNAKSFAKLQDSGVYAAKLEHYVQMNQYMGYWKLPYALYLATNKDDDDLYGEIVEYNSIIDSYARERAESVIRSPEPPERVSKTSTWYECRYCTFAGVCWKGEAPERNCRTCAFSAPGKDGRFTCGRLHVALGKEQQLLGCGEYKAREM